RGRRAAGAGFDLFHDDARFQKPSFRDQPAGGLGQARYQGGDDQAGNASDQENRLPSEGRHQPGAQLPGGHESDRKDHFIKQEESAAPTRTGKFTDISRRDWHFTADPNALDKAAGEQYGEASSDGTRQSHYGHNG